MMTADGRGGLDTLRVSVGSNTYVVDNVTQLDITRNDAGVDTVRACTSCSLGPQQENLALLGTKDLAGTGDSLANRLIGNNGANILNGAAGDDFLDGDDGHVTLHGGSGNDTYYVDNGDETDPKVSHPGYDRLLAKYGYVFCPRGNCTVCRLQTPVTIVRGL